MNLVNATTSGGRIALGRGRLLLAPVLLLAAFAASLAQIQPAAAEPTVGDCREIRSYARRNSEFGHQEIGRVDAYGSLCFVVYMRDGYTYTIDVNAIPGLGCPPNRPCRNLEDSTVELFAYRQPGVRLEAVPLGASNYTSMAFNDDIRAPTHEFDTGARSSRIVYTTPGSIASGASSTFIVKVAGYGSADGWFKLEVHEALTMVEPPCQTFWC